MKKLENKRKKMVIIGILVIVLLLSAGSYAYWSWNSSNNKTVIFNTSKEIQEYIVYDDGESKFIGDFQASDSYLGGIYTTISIKKTEAALNYNLYGTIYMDINEIGEYMRVSSALKWVITTGNSTTVGEVLSEGNFYEKNVGDTLTLTFPFDITTTEQEFTVWIWIDKNESDSEVLIENLVSETLDVNVFTQVDQVVS